MALLLVFNCPAPSSAGGAQDYALPDLEAVIIDKVLGFVSWPVEAVAKEGTFEVVVLGETPLLPRLIRLLAGRSVQGLPVRVQGLKSLAALKRMGRAHVLVLASDQEQELDAILAHVDKTPCLTISDAEDFAKRGVAVNLYLDQGRVRFAIRRAALAQARLSASYHLLSLARIIDEGW